MRCRALEEIRARQQDLRYTEADDQHLRASSFLIFAQPGPATSAASTTHPAGAGTVLSSMITDLGPTSDSGPLQRAAAVCQPAVRRTSGP